MHAFWTKLLTRCGVDPRVFTALLRAFILMDLRGQHYARATATEPHYLFTPLFWVVGQCLTLSAITSLVLFARVDVFFFVFINLSASLLVLATTVLVEFNEVVLDPRDLDILGHRPIASRTYAAARFANLLFYVALIYIALNLFPLIVGAGLRDAGPWYIPAYLAASLAGHLAVAALVIAVLSYGGPSSRLEHLKEILAWTQIVVLFIFVYAGQLVIRPTSSNDIIVWGAFPPDWIKVLPSTWLAWFVEAAAYRPDLTILLIGLLLILLALAAGIVTVLRVGRLYQTMHPAVFSHRTLPMPANQLGRVGGGWLPGDR